MHPFQLDGRRYLLVSAKPAPNGPPHIGHLGGPYLRQDLLSRHYALRGADIRVLGGTDPVDSYIALRADQDGLDPAAVAHAYHHRIHTDFATYDIDFDDFVEPLSPAWRERYVAGFAEVAERAGAQGQLVGRAAPFPFTVDGRPAGGARLCGRCPDCDLRAAGYFCENCGAHFEPGEMRDPETRDGIPSEPVFTPHHDLFFTIGAPHDRLASLAKLGVPDDVREITARQFRSGRTHIRLTEPSIWGVPRPGENRSWFGHGLLYAYCRMLGRRYQELTGVNTNPFDDGSDVTTVNLFGIDNTVSHMVNIQAIGEEIAGWKGFDAFVVNRFLLLEGRKISTSARHLISLRALTEVGGMDSDGARFTLAAVHSTDHQYDLHLAHLVHLHDDVFVRELVEPARRALTGLADAGSCAVPPALIARFEPLFARTCDDYGFPTFDPARVVATLRQWANGPDSRAAAPEERYGWLKTLTLLLEPVTPRLAGLLWRALGAHGRPRLAMLSTPTTPLDTPELPAPSPISVEGLTRAIHASRHETSLSAAPTGALGREQEN